MVVALDHDRPAPGMAMDFDGVDDYITHPLSYFDFSDRGEFTLESLVRMTEAGHVDQWVISRAGAVAGFALALKPDGRVSSLLVDSGGNLVVVNTPDVIPFNEWVHIAATYDGATLRLYYGGDTSPRATADAPSGGLTGGSVDSVIGRDEANTNKYLDTEIGMARVWGVERSGQQLKDARYAHLNGYEPGLLLDTRFTAGQGSTVRNYASPGFEGDGERSADYIDCGSDSSIDNVFAGGGTVEARVDPYSEGNPGKIIGKFGFIYVWVLRVKNQGNGAVELDFRHNFDDTDGQWTTTIDALPLHTWSHVAVAYNKDSDANVPTFYVNGSPVASGDVTTESAPVGTAQGDGGGNLRIMDDWHGRGEEFRMWDDIRTDTEISNNWDSRLAGTEANLVLYHPPFQMPGGDSYDFAGPSNGSFSGGGVTWSRGSGDLERARDGTASGGPKWFQHWPLTVPDHWLIPTSREMGDPRVRTDMDAGPAKIRRKHTAEVNVFKLKIELTGKEYQEFVWFIRNTLRGGSRRFRWWDPLNDELREFRIGEDMPTLRGRSGASDPDKREWEGRLTLEEMPT